MFRLHAAGFRQLPTNNSYIRRCDQLRGFGLVGARKSYVLIQRLGVLNTVLCAAALARNIKLQLFDVVAIYISLVKQYIQKSLIIVLPLNFLAIILIIPSMRVKISQKVQYFLWPSHTFWCHDYGIR
jgi:hypothetical protein